MRRPDPRPRCWWRRSFGLPGCRSCTVAAGQVGVQCHTTEPVALSDVLLDGVAYTAVPGAPERSDAGPEALCPVWVDNVLTDDVVKDTGHRRLQVAVDKAPGWCPGRVIPQSNPLSLTALLLIRLGWGRTRRSAGGHSRRSGVGLGYLNRNEGWPVHPAVRAGQAIGRALAAHTIA